MSCGIKWGVKSNSPWGTGMQNISRISCWGLEGVDWLEGVHMPVRARVSTSECKRITGWIGGIMLDQLHKSFTQAGCDFSTADLNLRRGRNQRLQTRDEHALAPSRWRQNNYCALFWTQVRGGGGDNTLWSSIFIIPFSSLFPALPPFADLKLPLSLIHSFPFFASAPSSLLDRGMAEIIIMFWHMALAPRTLRILTQSGSCQCDSPYCS